MTCSPAFLAEITWRAAYAAASNRRHTLAAAAAGPVDVCLFIVDHFEPAVGQADRATARRRLEEWIDRYPVISSRHRDSGGRHPSHGYFYPWDEFDREQFDLLAAHCREGWGEIEIQLHHSGDTAETLGQKLRECLACYSAGGMLTRWPDGSPAFGFVHGNWALDNSRRDGGCDYCGVDNELDVLLAAGCYADFTFPAWKHTAQPREVNRIFRAVDDAARPKSYDRGEWVRAGNAPKPSSLLLVPGPLVPFRRGPGLAMDDAEIAASHRFSPDRLRRWVSAGIHVAGRPDCLFIKLHTHGLQDANRRVLLDADLDALFSAAGEMLNDGERFRLHYVNAREACNIVRALEAGESAPIASLRNYLFRPPGESAPAAPPLTGSAEPAAP